MVKSYQDILAPVRFRDWKFNVVAVPRPSGDVTRYCCLQVEFDALPAGSVEGFHEPQKGRKWLLSEHMTDGEVIQTAMMAVLAALEHEAREEFTYKGQAIFGPHFDPEILVAVCETGHDDSRRAPIEGVGPDTALKGLDHDRILDGLRELGEIHGKIAAGKARLEALGEDDIEPKDPYRRER